MPGGCSFCIILETYSLLSVERQHQHCNLFFKTCPPVKFSLCNWQIGFNITSSSQDNNLQCTTLTRIV